MKNFFNNLISRCKEALSNISVSQKIKYGVIVGVVGVIVVTVSVVAMLNINEPEPVQEPIETYDKVSVIEIVDEETTDETATESALESESIDESESSKVTSQKETETAEISSKNEETSDAPSESVTDSQGEDPQPADPSGDNIQTDPEPAVTTSKQTQSTTAQAQSTTKLTQSTTKPIESTTKAQQTAPQPVESTTTKQTQSTTKPIESTTKAQQTAPQPVESTTARQTQSEPRPVETTVKQTQAQTKPVETTKKEDTPSQSNGQFVVSEKKYDYNGANVMILNVENQSSSAYTLTIVGHFNDKNGKELKSETRVFEGFPANYSNYFVFQPGIKFDNFTYEFKTSAYSGETYAQHLSYDPNPIEVYAAGNDFDIIENKDRIRASVNAKIIFHYNCDTYIDITSDMVLFDTTGEIFLIHKYNARFGSLRESAEYLWYTYNDILIENFKLPDNVNTNSRLIVALKTVKPQ